MNKRSNAYAAGLRENMIVIDHDLKLNRFGQPSYVVVEEEGVKKPISFFPERGKMRVPQYILKADDFRAVINRNEPHIE